MIAPSLDPLVLLIRPVLSEYMEISSNYHPQILMPCTIFIDSWRLEQQKDHWIKAMGYRRENQQATERS